MSLHGDFPDFHRNSGTWIIALLSFPRIFIEGKSGSVVDRNPYEAKRSLRGPPHYSLGAAHRFGRLPNRKSCDRSLAGNKISAHLLFAEV